MPEIIERGYLYIAQPPLFKVKRGKSSEIYLKDERSLEDHLINVAIDEVTITDHKNETRSGKDLQELLIKSRTLRNSINALSARAGNRRVVEQAAIAGAFDENILRDEELGMSYAKSAATRLDDLEAKNDKGWDGTFTIDRGYTFWKTSRGITERVRLSIDRVRSPDARRLDAAKEWLKDIFDGPVEITENGKHLAKINGPAAFYDRIQEAGRKGLQISRYKGLGEMNPEQLWETTLDPNVRTLLQVKVSDAIKADELFSTLMGDVVEPRREFIQDNALKSNIDA